MTRDTRFPSDIGRQALDSLPLTAAVLDEDGTIVWTDSAWQEFAVANDLDGQPDSVGENYISVSRRTDELGEQAADGILAVLSGEEETYSLEYACHSPDERRWFLMWAGGFDFSGDRYVTVAHFDITDRVEAEQDLSETAASLGTERDQLALLNQVVRHDIRNDIQVIAAYAEMVREDIADSDPADDSLARLDKILAQCQQVVDLTHSLRDVSTVLTGEAEPTLEPVDLVSVLTKELETVRQSYDPDSWKLTVTGEDALPDRASVLANGMLSSVVGNLLSNAVVHNDDRVRIHVVIEQRDERVVMTVADDGPGVPPDHRREVFGRGEKGFGSSGSGLGLYLVDQLVDVYGGDVWIEDSDLGGAAFVVSLPAPV